ncbi:hypothetical protein PENSPDRAFT_752670 [Peniophora sp. CONT]|nr:hypothetical protein PENSPDRAFT_752670 [Peniophora sp. CONT]
MSQETCPVSMEELARARWLDAFRALDSSLSRLRPTDVNAPRERSRIDAEALGIRYLLSAVNGRRNELALPFMLPPEVLARIFSSLADIDPINIKPFSSRRTLGWVSVTHVCRRWRQVSSNDPTLWNHVCPDGKQPWDIFIQRAREAPLFVKGTLPDDLSDASHCVQSILARQHLLKELCLGNIHPPHLKNLIFGLVKPSPELEVLNVRYFREWDIFCPPLHSGYLFAMTPNLRHLVLCGVGFPWGGGGSATLTEFSWEYGARFLHVDPPRLAHGFDDVANTLRHMPALKRLSLIDALPERPAEADSHPIFLPDLEELHIANANDSCWYLWSQLRIPSSCCLRVFSTHYTKVDSLIISTLRAHLHTLPMPCFSELDIENSLGTAVLELCQEGGASTMATSCERLPALSLTIGCDDVPLMIARLLVGIRLEDIHTLKISGNIGQPEDIRSALLIPARSVAHLHLAGSGAETGLAALLPLPTTVLLQPGAIQNFGFGTTFRYAGEAVSASEALDRVLLGRTKMGSAEKVFRRLYISTCDVGGEDVERWKAYVEDLEWDGDQGLLTDGADSDESLDEEDEDSE